AVHATTDSSHEILPNPGGVDVPGRFPDKARFVEPEGPSVAHQVFITECLRVLEQHIVHRPELPLRSGCLRAWMIAFARTDRVARLLPAKLAHFAAGGTCRLRAVGDLGGPFVGGSAGPVGAETARLDEL